MNSSISRILDDLYNNKIELTRISEGYGCEFNPNFKVPAGGFSPKGKPKNSFSECIKIASKSWKPIDDYMHINDFSGEYVVLPEALMGILREVRVSYNDNPLLKEVASPAWWLKPPFSSGYVSVLPKQILENKYADKSVKNACKIIINKDDGLVYFENLESELSSFLQNYYPTGTKMRDIVKDLSGGAAEKLKFANGDFIELAGAYSTISNFLRELMISTKGVDITDISVLLSNVK